MDGRKTVVKGVVLRVIPHPRSSLIIMDSEVRLKEIHVHLALAVATTRGS